MKKTYYAYFPRNFSNEYTLYSVSSEQDEEAITNLKESYDPYNSDLRRVTLKEANKMIAQEKYARQVDPAFSGYGAIDIVPAYNIINNC